MVSGMAFIRWVLIALSAASAGYIIYVSIHDHPRPDWVGLVVPLGFALNIFYLLRSAPHKASGRISRLIGLWMDAKEAELRRRSKRDD
jgi:hypothetical protein